MIDCCVLRRIAIVWAANAAMVSGATAQVQEVSLSGQVELPRLIDLAAQRLHLNIEYDAAALKMMVTLRIDRGLSDQELWFLVSRVLAARGFTTVRAPGEWSYSVVKLADAGNLARLQKAAARGSLCSSGPVSCGRTRSRTSNI
jgi:hypothetical protein